MPFGYLDTKYIDLPANIDERYLQGLRTRAGVDFPRILRELDSRLATLNTFVDPLVAALINPTTEIYAEGGASPDFEINERGEYTLARPQLAEIPAHMLPLRGYDASLGFTEDGLENMSLSKITKNIDALFAGWRRLHRKEALKRLFSKAEVRVDKKTSVTSPGFAGSGTGDNVFTGSYPDGNALPGGYSHYYTTTAAALATALDAAIAQLRRWQMGPFDLIAPQAEIDLVAALPKFVKASSALVRTGADESEALVDPNIYVGVYDGVVRVRQAIVDTSDPNIGIFKSFGNLNPNNPLAWRYDELKGRGAVVRSRTLYPLDQAVLKQDFGIGVNNRTAAALIFVNADGDPYEDPSF
jgi:hypothetical protein